jgi:hypothetical protein
MRIIVTTVVMAGFLYILPGETHARDKCWLISSRKVGKIECKYRWKKKKSKLRTWARRWCQNTGIGKDFEAINYSNCNKKGKKCRRIVGTCTK